MDPIQQIREQLERLTELSADELTELGNLINETYDAARNPEDQAPDATVLTTLRDARRAVTDRQVEMSVAAEAEAAALAELDAEFAAASGTQPSDEEVDLTVLEGLSDEDLAGLADFTDEDVAFWSAVAEVEGLSVEGIEVLNAEPPPAGDETPPAEEPETPAARAAAASGRLRSLPPLGRRTSQPVDEPPVTAATGARLYGRADGPLLDAERVGVELSRAASAQGKQAGRQDRIVTVPLGGDIPMIPEGREVDITGMVNTQLADLRAHRTAAAASASSGVRQAAGTLCAPPRTDYGVVALGSDEQPMSTLFPVLGESEADAMKTLQILPHLDFDFFTSGASGIQLGGRGIDSATATENASGSNYPKVAARIACPEFDTCEQRGVWLELVYDNLRALAWPEFTEASNQGGRTLLARHLEELLLEDWFDYASALGNLLVPITPQPYNANHSLLYTIMAVVSADRGHTRGMRGDPYVVAAPAHLEAQLATEVGAYFNVGSPSIDQAVMELINRMGVTVEFYLDHFGISDDARYTHGEFLTLMSPVVGSGGVPSFPCEARIGIARDDAGYIRRGAELNLGVTRTEDDIENNNYRTFYETWQRQCFRSDHVFVADVPVSPTATHAPAGSVANLCDEGS